MVVWMVEEVCTGLFELLWEFLDDMAVSEVMAKDILLLVVENSRHCRVDRRLVKLPGWENRFDKLVVVGNLDI
jgi:hypothetical protein